MSGGARASPSRVFLTAPLSPVRQVPYFLNVGNHEYDTPSAAYAEKGRVRSFYNGSDSGGECGVPTHRQFLAPLAPDVDAPWYSLEMGPAHVVAMSTEHDFRRGSAQYAWLEADLNAVDKTVTPWIIFGGHRPGYIDSAWSFKGNNGAGDVEFSALWIEHVEPLLLAAGVQLVVWGHNHQVQRLCAVRAGACAARSETGADGVASYSDPPAPIHMVIGTGGAPYTNATAGADFDENRFLRHGYARVECVGATKLRWDWYDAVEAEVVDSLVITQTDPRLALGGGGGADAVTPVAIAALVLAACLIVTCAVLVAQCRRGAPGAKKSPSLYGRDQRPDDNDEEMMDIGPKSDAPVPIPFVAGNPVNPEKDDTPTEQI